MAEFWFYLQIGFKHVLDLTTPEHILFLIALAASYSFKEWKPLLVLIGLFTLGHTVFSLLSAFGFMQIRGSLNSLLTPIIILIVAAYSLLTAGKTAKGNGLTAIGFITLSFGIIHGLSFLDLIKSIRNLTTTDKVLPLLEIGLGIGLGQIAVIFAILLVGYAVQNFARFSRRDWALVTSALVIGAILSIFFRNNTHLI